MSNSYFSKFNPLKRSSGEAYGCHGLRPSCEKFCPSYVPTLSSKKPGKWLIDHEEMSTVKNALKRHNWLASSDMDLFAPDVPLYLVKEIFLELADQEDQTFFVTSKNVSRMREFAQEREIQKNIVWGNSAATQEEIDLIVQFRGLFPNNIGQEALFLSPLVEEVTVPPEVLSQYDFVIVEGYEGKKEIYFELDWALNVQKAIAEISEGDRPEFIVNKLGSLPFYLNVSINTRRKKIYPLSNNLVEELDLL